MRRAIQDTVENKLAELILSGKLKDEMLWSWEDKAR